MESSGACCPVNGGYSTGTRGVDREWKSAITSRMIPLRRLFPNLPVTSVLVLAMGAPMALYADAVPRRQREAVEVEFRGCDLAGWCTFQTLSPILRGESSLRVRPDGVEAPDDDPPVRVALRNRLNALLANMIHQAHRIVLHDLRDHGDGTFAAVVTVHGVDIASDSTIRELRTKKIRRPSPPD